MKKRENKKAQVTLFIILAIVIIIAVLVAFSSKFQSFFSPKSPEALIPKACLEKEFIRALNLTLLSGEEINPNFFFKYQSQNLTYLCYTNEYYKTCVVQKPLLKQSIEDQVAVEITSKVNSCFESMQRDFEKQGYDVKFSGSKKPLVSLEPSSSKLEFNFTLTIDNGEISKTFMPGVFRVNLDSKAYELIMTSVVIVNYEAHYGDSIPEYFMSFYPYLRVEKLKQDDGTKVYIISNRDGWEKLQFATRSLAWPAGYYTQ